MYYFIKERGCPYCLHENTLKLNNISSQVIAQDYVKEKILRFHEMSKDKIEDFRDNI